MCDLRRADGALASDAGPTTSTRTAGAAAAATSATPPKGRSRTTPRSLVPQPRAAGGPATLADASPDLRGSFVYVGGQRLRLDSAGAPLHVRRVAHVAGQ